MNSQEFSLPKGRNISHNVITTVIRQDILDQVGQRNAPLRKRLTEWVKIIENLELRSLNDVRRAYPSADGIKLKSKAVVTVFNIKGNEYRLLALIDFEDGIVQVLDVLTHAEYDKELWKDRY